MELLSVLCVVPTTSLIVIAPTRGASPCTIVTVLGVVILQAPTNANVVAGVALHVPSAIGSRAILGI